MALIERGFEDIIKMSFEREKEDRDFISFTYGQKSLLNLVNERFKSPIHKEKAMSKYGPLAEWFAEPKTFDEFMGLKNNLYSLTCYMVEKKLFGDFDLQRSINVDENRWREDNKEWYKTLDWVFAISDILRIWPQENTDYIKSQRRKQLLGATVYGELEYGDVGYGLGHLQNYQSNESNFKDIEGSRDPEIREMYNSHQDPLTQLCLDLNWQRKNIYNIDGFWYRPIVKRVGLIIADLRVGDHLAHGRLLEKAKITLGTRGCLLVVIPNNKTIYATTNKTDSWPDEDRLYRLRSNRFVDLSIMVKMPEEYYKNPDEYWKFVWKSISPDFIFLGEKDHPLENLYIEQSKTIGGILIVDDSVVTRRSRDLLKIK
jgi:glycerol-3-phosphate cytidylyltransferase-like family protein